MRNLKKKSWRRAIDNNLDELLTDMRAPGSDGPDANTLVAVSELAEGWGEVAFKLLGVELSGEFDNSQKYAFQVVSEIFTRVVFLEAGTRAYLADREGVTPEMLSAILDRLRDLIVAAKPILRGEK